MIETKVRLSRVDGGYNKNRSAGFITAGAWNAFKRWI
jgi:hypothetical protein